MRAATLATVLAGVPALVACSGGSGGHPSGSPGRSTSVTSAAAASRPGAATPSAPATPTPSTSASATTSASASAATVAHADAAVKYARSHGMVSSVAVVDTRTGALATAGDATRQFPTASVAKALIATRLLLLGDMHGHRAAVAHEMITRSDNDDAYALYPTVGGDHVLPALAAHYKIGDLGAPPPAVQGYAGFWGSTRVTADGLVRLYAAVRHDPTVWPWLGRTMHQHQPTTTAGEPNDFGLADLPDTAVKNGWNTGRDRTHAGTCEINTTGFVDHDRYAVVILSEGPDSYYYDRGEQIVTHEAHLLFPSRTGP